MTDEQIRKLRELEAKATPGPWESMDGPNVGIIKDATERAVAMTIWMLRDFPGIAVPDAAFIAAARNALPELLDEVELLRARCERLEKVREAAEACVSYFVPVRDAVIADLKAALEGE